MFKQLLSLKTLPTLLLVGCLALSANRTDARGSVKDVAQPGAKAVASTRSLGSRVAIEPLPAYKGANQPMTYNADLARKKTLVDPTMPKSAKAAAAVPTRTAPVAPLRAAITYTDDEKYGLVEVTANGLNVLREHDELQAEWGGAGLGDKFYYNTYAEVFGGVISYIATYHWLPSSNWRMDDYNPNPDIDVLSMAMACDPVTELIYGCFYSSDGSHLEIGTMDPTTMKRNGTIGDAQTIVYGMGFDSKGTLWGIDAAGVLYTISTKDGSYTKVAETGLTTFYKTTGAVDYFNDVFYYAACPEGTVTNPMEGWALYAIDLNDNYKVEKCWDTDYELGGMYVALAPAKDEAPSTPTLTSADFEGSSLSGNVTFTAPSLTYGGSALTGSLEYTVMANSIVLATGTTTAGATEQIEVSVPTSGSYAISVYVENENGRSPKSETISQWIGYGKPLTPSNFVATYSIGDTGVVLTWDAVTSSFENGYFEPANAKYTVTRSENGGEPVVIAENISTTTYTDNTVTTLYTPVYQYYVVCINEDALSDAVASRYVAVGPIVAPFQPDFTQEYVQGYFTTKDFNDTNAQWRYSSYYQAMQLSYSGNSRINQDVALVTIPVELKGGYAYNVSYFTYVGSYGIDYGVGLQASKDMNTFTTVIEPETLNNTTGGSWDAPLVQQGLFQADEDGIYYFLVRALANQQYGMNIYLENFKIEEGLSVKAPNVVTDVTFTPPYDGSNQLEVSFVAPSVTIEGKKLSELSKIEVYRDGMLVNTLRNPTFGQKVTFTDHGRYNGNVEYRIVAYNTFGEGLPYTATAHMGVNLAVKPVNITIEQDKETYGMVTLTWDAVNQDIDGNEIDPSLITYYVLASDGQSLVVSDIPATNTTTTFRAWAVNAGQGFVYYYIVPRTAAGGNVYAGGYGISDVIPVGTPYEMPVHESFPNANVSYSWVQTGTSQMTLSGGTSSQYLTYGPQDDDGGMIKLQCAPGYYGELVSANINIADEDDAAISFYYTGVPDIEGYYIETYVKHDGQVDQLCPAINTADAPEKGWNRVQASLSPWKGKTVQIGFYIRCINNNFIFSLDNITLKRYVANDLRASEITAPLFLSAGKTNQVNVNVVNDGSDDAPAGYEVDLYADGKLVQTQEGPALKSFNSAALTFNHVPSPLAKDEQTFYAVIRYGADQDLSNNTSDEYTFSLLESAYPAVEDLKATLPEGSTSTELTWTEPDHQPKLNVITESFETYEPFVQGNFGDWIVRDEDGGKTYSLGAGNYPNAGQPMSWMVIDPAGINRLWFEVTRTGSKAILAMSSSEGECDDWLISPELPGVKQTVSFYAASTSSVDDDYGEELFNFYYSTTGTDTDDFILLTDEPEEVPMADYDDDEGDQITHWYEYSYELPEGAKYFAIQYVSDDIFGLLIDDITYTLSDEAIELEGYNVYRNGDKVNDELIATTTYTDELADVEDGDYSYVVETVYDKGNSGASNIATIRLSGVDDVTGTVVEIRGGKGTITVKGAEGLDVQVYNAAGMTLYNLQPDATVTLTVEPGIYVVKVGPEAAKVIVY